MEKAITELLKQNKNAFYLFDIAKLKQRIRDLRKALPEGTALAYAVKANPFLEKEIEEEVERFEVCSPGEGRICEALHLLPEKLVISGVYKSEDFIEELVSGAYRTAIFTAESEAQFELLKCLAGKYRCRLSVLLRVTNDSQFGMDEAIVKRLICERENTPELQIRGLQFFSGTQKTSIKKLAREVTYLDTLISELRDEYGFETTELEYGPGFPASYFVGEEIDEPALWSAFGDLLRQMTNHPQTVLELGRAMAYPCGSFFTHVVDKKTNKGINYLLVNAGMHQLVYYGQMMAMKKPVVHLCKEGATGEFTANVCGALCSMNDILVKDLTLPQTSVGDVLCFENTGAYCVTEGIALFLSRDLPAVYLKRENGEVICVRKPMETMELNCPKY